MSIKLKIAVLSENNSNMFGFRSEHGLAFYIEIDKNKFLFDTGASDFFLENAAKLKIDLKELKGIILSHGHYDHCGGLAKLESRDVYIQDSLFQEKYKLEGNEYKYIGLEFTKDHYENNNGLCFKNVSGVIEIDRAIKLITDFKKDPAKEDRFFVKKGDDYIPDNFDDELIMTINTDNGLVIITGCAHSGLINIIEKALEVNNTTKIYGLFGGFHLSKLPEIELAAIARIIDSYKIENIGISHCTGYNFAKYLKYGKVFDLNVGQSYSLKKECANVK
jgi:7,8-dihydropterin-6-yl-methyl-4-(beta-D-ribofuranosyl)aminobenzene 5'-phosphate synthase